MRSIGLRFALLVALLGLIACKKKTPPPPATSSGSASSPMGMVVQGRQITGKVVETIDAGGYTYVKIATAGKQVWAAVRQTQLAKGQPITVTGVSAMHNWKSKTLKRTWKVVYFGRLGKGRPAGHGMRGPHGAGFGKAALSKAHKGQKRPRLKFDKPLAKAMGKTARTVAEVYTQRAALAGKTVRVHGKVAKFSRRIMGKNWIHLQDGTGTPDGNDYDLTVTTQATVKAGDRVIVEGTVKSDVNVGAGYRYKVLVEKAKVSPAP